MNTERDKYLTEAMGICFWIGHDAEKCGCTEKAKRGAPIDFSEWGGFGALWEWAQEQEWWFTFCCEVDLHHYVEGEYIAFTCTADLRVINPDRFADAVYEFLKEE